MRSHRYALLLALCVGILVATPQVLRTMDSRYQGVPISVSPDEGTYQTHLQEALLGRMGQAGKGITARSVDEPHFHLSLIEEAEGLLFGWTGLRATQVFQILDFIIPALLALALYFLFLAYGFSKKQALIGSALFCALQLANLNRPVHQRENFLLVTLALLLLQKRNVFGGVLMGLLVGMYPWGWMAVWCTWGVTLLLTLISKHWKSVRTLSVTGIIGVVVALPFLRHRFSLQSHPAYEDTVVRAGLIHWRAPESLPWSLLFLIIAATAFLYWLRSGRQQKDIPIVALALAACITLNQQFVHGYLLMFRSHLLFFLTLSVVTILLTAINRWKQSVLLLVAGGASLIVCSALLYENKNVFGQWTIKDDQFAHQHLGSLYELLDALPRSVILSDPNTSLFLAGNTKHDVLYTIYLQHTLLTHEEVAKAFCMTQLPIPPEKRTWEQQNILAIGNGIWSQLDLKKREELRTEDIRLVTEACRELDRDPNAALEREEVQFILWNEREEHHWTLDRLNVSIRKIAEGDGWSLWKS